MKTNWRLLGKIRRYYVWKHGNGVPPIYQVSTDNKPPSGGGGYYTLYSLLKMKDIPSADIGIFTAANDPF